MLNEETPAVLIAGHPPMSSFLRRHAMERGDHLAVIDGATGESLTYRALFDGVQSLAQGLRNEGIGSGDRIAVVALNSAAYVELIWALADFGAIVVPLNVRLSPAELAANLADAEVAAVVTDAMLLPLATAGSAGLPGVRRYLLGKEGQEGWAALDSVRVSPATDSVAALPITAEDTCTLLYTSGTTGSAKGCMLPHRSWLGYALNLAATIGMSADDVYLAFLPAFHVAGLGTLLSQMILGGTIVTQAMADPAQMHRSVEAYGVTIVFVVPGISIPFLEFPREAASEESSLRLIISGAGIEKPDFGVKVRAKYDAEFVAIYGQTEAGTKITWAGSEELRADARSYGTVMPLLDYRIVDENDQDVADGEAGELVIRGMTVMQGYWGNPDATSETLRNGWHHTGDVFVRDGKSGQLRMVDRVKYLIKTGGENVYPQEVENVLQAHPDVADLAVIGIPDPDWGETVKAFIVARPDADLTRNSLDQWARQSLAGFKVPRFIEFVESIPRNVSGKTLKNELNEYVTDESQRVQRKDTPDA